MALLAHALLTALKDHGAHEIFGIPGDFVLPLFKVIEESNILPSFTLSHEPAVGFAADASARYHGGLGVAAVTYGAGGFQYRQFDRGGLRGALAGGRDRGRAWRARANQWLPAASPGAHGRYAACCLQGNHLRSGGADRSCNRTGADRAGVAQRPRNVAAGLSRISSRHGGGRGRARRSAVAAACGCGRARRMRRGNPRSASRRPRAPVVVVDVEIRRYGIEDKIAALARKLESPCGDHLHGARTSRTPSATSSRGTYLGAAGDPAITRLVEDADLVLMLGVILSDTNFALSNRAPRSTPHHSGLEPRGADRLSLLPRHAARRPDRGVGGARQAERAAAPSAS